MELKQYAAEHIIENGKHYPEKWVNRFFIEVADAQRALDAEREQRKFGSCEVCWNIAWVLCKDDEPNAVPMKCANGTTYWRCDYCWYKQQLAALQAQVQAKDAEIAALKEHQKLHDRIFERQKLLLSHYAGTIKEAAKRLRYSTHSIEQPEPYNSRTPIVAAFLEQALGVNAEELEKERDTLTHANARLREALDKLARLGNEPHYGNSTGNVIAQQALADTEGKEHT